MNRDPAAAESFYATVFDWKAETEVTEGTTYTTFRLDDDPVAGMMMMPDQIGPDVPGHLGDLLHGHRLHGDREEGGRARWAGAPPDD
ncbi:MAG: hypothetical protein U9O63_08775, partial [Actinomycetota bacterium]|nr:hypothetical protein [Actinomycetota bacterium]